MLAERLGTIIVNRKAIDDNFTLIITEPALGRKGTTLQRRRRRDQLEGRSRCIQTLGGAVEKRRIRVGVEQLPVVSQLVRIVGRIRDHGHHGAGLNFKNHHGAGFAQLLQLAERCSLDLGVDGELQVGASFLLTGQHVDEVDDFDFVGGAGQVAVLGMFQTDLAVGRIVIADQMWRQVARGVNAVVEVILLAVPGQL